MIFQLFDAIKDRDFFTFISIVISAAVLLLVCMPVHEMAHARTAYKLGDSTAKYQGRLTLNPFKHLDPLGSILIISFGFGFAKPVPVNMRNFKNPKRDMAITALAGPTSNITMGIFFIFLEVLTNYLTFMSLGFTFLYYTLSLLGVVFYFAGIINISLGIFNLIPIPPFDGSRILGYFLSDRLYYKIMQYERQIFLVVMVLLAFGVTGSGFSSVISKVYTLFYEAFSKLIGLLF